MNEFYAAIIKKRLEDWKENNKKTLSDEAIKELESITNMLIAYAPEFDATFVNNLVRGMTILPNKLTEEQKEKLKEFKL